MGPYFGTDGIRGRAGELLTPELALRAAYAFAHVISKSQPAFQPQRRPAIVVGRDSRLSSPMLEAAAVSGIALAGCDTLLLEIVPTPVVPFMVLKCKAAGGVMITASHNPVQDNGVKFFGPDGMKINGQLTSAIERIIDHPGSCTEPKQLYFGHSQRIDAAADYLRFVQQQFSPKTQQRTLKIVLDCAYGAAAKLAPMVFSQFGIAVYPINAEFDGSRVNVKCGATDLLQLTDKVRSTHADLGLAFDGDGDRVLAVDHNGTAVDGDQIIAIFATRLPRYRRQHAVVMTQMSNMGVEEALAARGIQFIRTEVGDTLVLEELIKQNLYLGGEQSGHIILRDKLPTGDGILAGLQLMQILRSTGLSLAELASAFPQYPQKLTNLRIHDRQAWLKDKRLHQRFLQIRTEYAKVRFYLRPSGTENVVRVLTEAQDPQQCQRGNVAVCEAFAAWDGGRQ